MGKKNNLKRGLRQIEEILLGFKLQYPFAV